MSSPESTSSHRMSSQEIRTSAWLASIFGLRMLGLFMILPVFVAHARTIPGGDNFTLVSWAMSIYGLTQGLLQLPYGMASDRFGRKPVIVTGLLVFAIGSLVAAWAPSVFWVMVGRALQGAGAISAAVTAYIADATREEHRTKAMAMVGSTIGLTFALSMVGAPILYAHIGMNGLFLLTAILSLASIFVVLLIVPAAPIQTNPPSPVPFLQVLGNPDLLRLNVGIFVLHLTQIAMFVVIPILLIDELHLPLPHHWQIYLPVVLASFLLMLPPIFHAERRGAMKQVFIGTIALLTLGQIGWVCLPLTLTNAIILLLIFFVAFNILEASLPSMVSRVAPAGSKGTALGIYNTTQALGLAAGGPIGGWVKQHYGSSAVFTICAVLCILWLCVAWNMRALPKRGQTKPSNT